MFLAWHPSPKVARLTFTDPASQTHPIQTIVVASAEGSLSQRHTADDRTAQVLPLSSLSYLPHTQSNAMTNTASMQTIASTTAQPLHVHSPVMSTHCVSLHPQRVPWVGRRTSPQQAASIVQCLGPAPPFTSLWWPPSPTPGGLCPCTGIPSVHSPSPQWAPPPPACPPPFGTHSATSPTWVRLQLSPRDVTASRLARARSRGSATER